MASTRRSPEEFTERSETRPAGRAVSEEKRAGATGKAQGGSSRSRHPMGLPARSTPAAHQRQPATVIPTDWRTRLHVRSSTTGRRVAGGKSSLYVSPLADRAERRGQLTELSAHLFGVKAAVAAGDSLLEAVGDGTLWGWRSREALSHALGVPLANWDRERGRTQAERLALVDRVLSELGVTQVRRGGWSVSGR